MADHNEQGLNAGKAFGSCDSDTSHMSSNNTTKANDHICDSYSLIREPEAQIPATISIITKGDDEPQEGNVPTISLVMKRDDKGVAVEKIFLPIPRTYLFQANPFPEVPFGLKEASKEDLSKFKFALEADPLPTNDDGTPLLTTEKNPKDGNQDYAYKIYQGYRLRRPDEPIVERSLIVPDCLIKCDKIQRDSAGNPVSESGLPTTFWTKIPAPSFTFTPPRVDVKKRFVSSMFEDHTELDNRAVKKLRLFEAAICDKEIKKCGICKKLREFEVGPFKVRYDPRDIHLHEVVISMIFGLICAIIIKHSFPLAFERFRDFCAGYMERGS